MTTVARNSRIFGRKRKWVVLVASGLISMMTASEVAVSQTLPPNAGRTCLASSPTIPFSAWFAAGNPATLNAVVTPANSVTFTNNPGLQNTDFYQWAFRMFLWLTSPTPATYGGTGLVMSSPEFYNLSPPDASGVQTLMQNPTRPTLHLPPFPVREPLPISLGLRVSNLGPHGLPVLKDKQGQFFEVAPLKLSATGKPLVLDSANQEVELAHVVRTSEGKVRFIGVNGNAIAGPTLQLHARAARVLKLKTSDLLQPQSRIAFKINPSLLGPKFHGPIFILPSGAVIDAGPGDADGNVQMTQAGSLIYYGETVNDVYAYFVTQINPVVTHNTASFPTTAANLASISTFVTAHGHTFLNPDALAIEIKSAWVDAATLPNPADYITMMAKVPTYNRVANPRVWTENGSQTIKVALVGMHVVGSAAGHPEMIWSTFEHVGNTPNVAYDFNDTGGTQHSQPADPIGSGSTWLFCGATAPAVGFTAGAVASSATSISSTIAATPVKGTSALRLAPWGAPDNQVPNPLIPTVAASNTQIVSINEDVHSQMNANDVRSKYLFGGATWTENGAPPSLNFPSGNVVGTSHLANSTLEAFTQSEVFVQGIFPGPGCFSCHQSNTTDVSHIFGSIKALF